MAGNLKELDPVQGLIDYVNDVKPYHTKVIESLVEYVGFENVNVSIDERHQLDVHLDYSLKRPFKQTYIATGYETFGDPPKSFINATVPIITNIKFVGSPPQRVYDFYGTYVYLNGVLQKEIFGSPLEGDYYIQGINKSDWDAPINFGKIIFKNPLKSGDIVEIYTLTQEYYVPNSCTDGGFASLPFDDPNVIPIVSPDPKKTLTEFPAITINSFIVAGDQRNKFDPLNNLTFKISSFIDDRMVGLCQGPPTCSTPSFYVIGDRRSDYQNGTIFSIVGSEYNDGNYSVNGAPSYDPVNDITEISVDQPINSNIVGGFLRIKDNNNSGTFTVVNSIYTKGTAFVSDYTTVFVSGITFTPPNSSDYGENRKYISVIKATAIEYNKILSYSNILKYYDSSVPSSILHTPDEGIAYAKILDLQQGTPGYFIIEGNYESSNLFVGDEFFVVGSTDNDGSYIIRDISYGYESTVGKNATRLSVDNVHDDVVDGFVKLNIPANVFVVDKDYTAFFKQGTKINVITGNKTGTYNVINSKYINGETHIRVIEDILEHKKGRPIIRTISDSNGNGFVFYGDITSEFSPNTKFNIIGSINNNGIYTVSNTPNNPSFDSNTQETTIYVDEDFDLLDSTGEIHKFVKGLIEYLPTGYGQSPQLCDLIPQTLVNVTIKDKLYIDNINIISRDDILVYGIDDQSLGYDLPKSTIFASGTAIGGGPDIIISNTEPLAPTENMLWFDTSPNTATPSGPGILKQYTLTAPGSPILPGWIEVPNNKAYWIDTDKNYMYYRIIYQYYDNSATPPQYPTPSLSNGLDTGWVLLYTKIPGYDDIYVGESSREQIGFETFFVKSTSSGQPDPIFNLSSLSIPSVGSPPQPDKTLIEVFVNGAPADITILSNTSFRIDIPVLRINDFVEVRIFDNTRDPSNSFVGAFDANASIAEDFNLLKGYKFTIDGTESATSSIFIPDTPDGRVYDIFKPLVGSPPTRVLSDTKLEIINSGGSPNNDGIYTILDATQLGTPVSHVVLTVLESINDSGFVSGSPLLEGGKALFKQWFQYMIVNTTSNEIVVIGDATKDISYNGSPAQKIQIVHSTNNNGVYTINASPVFDGRNTTITVLETIPDVGNTGGWIESL